MTLIRTPIPRDSFGTPSGTLIDAAIAEYGARRVLFQALVASFAGLARQPSLDDLDNRMLQDIGLPPKEHPPDPFKLLR